MSKPKSGPGFVYLMHATGTDLYKIGLSANPIKRLYKLNGESPYEIKILHTIFVDSMLIAEGYFHRIFGAKRIKNEWFRLDSYDVSVFCKCNGKNEDELILEVAVKQGFYQNRDANSYRKNGNK